MRSMIRLTSIECPPPQAATTTKTRLLSLIAGRRPRRLNSLAFRILNDTDDAEEVLRDVFLKILEKVPTFNKQLGFPGRRAVVTTRNNVIHLMRSKQRRAQIVDVTPYRRAQEEAAHETEPRMEFDQAVGIRTAQTDLPHEQLRAVEMAFFGGPTQCEIAQPLREPVGNLEIRILRGMVRLLNCPEAGA